MSGNEFAFLVQLGHPKIRQRSFPTFQTIQEAVLRLFRVEEESVYLFWRQIPVRFRYREGLSHNFDDILAMVWLVQRDNRGITRVSFRTQVLTIGWEVCWDENDIRIDSRFTANEERYGAYARALNQRPQIRMKKEAFLREWKMLLHQIVVAFEAGHVTIEDGTERRKWEMLQRVEQRIEGYGQLYRRGG